MLAAAAAEQEPAKILRRGLGEIPEKSRLAAGIRDVLDWYANGISYVEVCNQLHTRWNENSKHHWCHTISNAQVVAIALLWSEGDFETAITRAVWPGFDTDCNGATVGSIMGMMLGAKNLPEKWTAIMRDTVHTSIEGYNVASISGTAAEMFRLYRTMGKPYAW